MNTRAIAVSYMGDGEFSQSDYCDIYRNISYVNEQFYVFRKSANELGIPFRNKIKCYMSEIFRILSLIQILSNHYDFGLNIHC